MRRGEVWWADLPPPAGRRPVLLLSRDSSIRVRALITVAAVTTRRRGLQAEVALGIEDGMPRGCVVNLDVIDTIPKALLKSRVCALTAEKREEVLQALHFALALDCPGTLGQTDIIAS